MPRERWTDTSWKRRRRVRQKIPTGIRVKFKNNPTLYMKLYMRLYRERAFAKMRRQANRR